MTIIAILGLVLIYALIGVLYLVAYIAVMKPQPHDAQLGLTVIFWPVYIVIEIVLSFAVQFGRTAKAIEAKLRAGGITPV